MKLNSTIRLEREADWARTKIVLDSAFGGLAESELVSRVRREVDPYVALLADVDGTCVGMIMFTPVMIPGVEEALTLGLAPMAVHPDFQRQGIGSKLVEAGLGQAKEMGAVACVVLGHPGYYPKFGFAPASEFGLTSEYDVPDGVFMARELTPGALGEANGTVRYHSVFAGV